MELDRYLEDLEKRLIPDQEEAVLAAWEEWQNHTRSEDKIFRGLERVPSLSKLEWPNYCINEALEDEDKMILREFYSVNRKLESGEGYRLHVRPNYGVVNIPTMYGMKVFIMDDKFDTLPTVIPDKEGRIYDWLKDGNRPDMYEGNGKIIFQIIERFADIFRNYPKIGKYVHMNHPDLQGPMDNCELIRGSELFFDLYDSPEDVHMLLESVTNLMESITDSINNILPSRDGTCGYFDHFENGGIVIRDDSAMNLSPEMYHDFIAPYDERLLKKYGGIVHFCGKGDHYIEQLARLEGLRGINMSQPHLNDMEIIFHETIDRGINLSLNLDAKVGNHDVRHLCRWG